MLLPAGIPLPKVDPAARENKSIRHTGASGPKHGGLPSRREIRLVRVTLQVGADASDASRKDASPSETTQHYIFCRPTPDPRKAADALDHLRIGQFRQPFEIQIPFADEFGQLDQRPAFLPTEPNPPQIGRTQPGQFVRTWESLGGLASRADRSRSCRRLPLPGARKKCREPMPPAILSPY